MLLDISTYLDTSLPDGGELMLQHMDELHLRDAVLVHDDAVRLEHVDAEWRYTFIREYKGG